jgi:hypothetical protein
MRDTLPPETATVSWLARCKCGNSQAHEGFYACDPEGHPQPAGLLVCCDRCGTITERTSGKPRGHRSFYPPADIES